MVPKYTQEEIEKINSKTSPFPSCSDPLYHKAVDLAMERGEVSVSMLQREFFLGYNRARRLFEAMENRGMLEQQEANRGCLKKFIGAHRNE